MIVESPKPPPDGDDAGAAEPDATQKNVAPLFMVWSRFHGANSDSLPPPPAEGQTDLDGLSDERHPPAVSAGRAFVTHPLIPWLGLLLLTYGSNRVYCTGLSIP